MHLSILKSKCFSEYQCKFDEFYGFKFYFKKQKCYSSFLKIFIYFLCKKRKNEKKISKEIKRNYEVIYEYYMANF